MVQCTFCLSEVDMVECHGHMHCTRCRMPNEKCCEGEVEDNYETESQEEQI